MDIKIKREKRQKRHKRVKAKIIGISKRPRLCVFRSAKYIYAQLIDDGKGHTLAAVSSLEIKQSSKIKGQAQKKKIKTEKIEKVKEVTKNSKVAIAYEVGKIIAKKAQALKIKKVVFDRGGYKYHGMVKSLADGAREGGLIF